jgi:hypothetical protein
MFTQHESLMDNIYTLKIITTILNDRGYTIIHAVNHSHLKANYIKLQVFDTTDHCIGDMIIFDSQEPIFFQQLRNAILKGAYDVDDETKVLTLHEKTRGMKVTLAPDEFYTCNIVDIKPTHDGPRVIGKIDLDAINKPKGKIPKPKKKYNTPEPEHFCINCNVTSVDNKGDWCYSCGELDEG